MDPDETNEAFADRMREKRGDPPKPAAASPLKVFGFVAVWQAGHKELPDHIEAFGLTPGHVLMVPCIPTGIPLAGRSHYLAHESEYTAAHLETSDDGPDIWRVTFKPGRTPKGW